MNMESLNTKPYTAKPYINLLVLRRFASFGGFRVVVFESYGFKEVPKFLYQGLPASNTTLQKSRL